MSHRVSHCPFLNRADSRCSNHFSLDKLQSAFDHCFGQYKGCATYLEMLDERKDRGGDCGSVLAQGNLPTAAVYATLTSHPTPVNAHIHIRLPATHV